MLEEDALREPSTRLLSIPQAPSSRPRPSSSQRGDSPQFKSPQRVQRGSSLGPLRPGSAASVISPLSRPTSPNKGDDVIGHSPPRGRQQCGHEELVIPKGRITPGPSARDAPATASLATSPTRPVSPQEERIVRRSPILRPSVDAATSPIRNFPSTITLCSTAVQSCFTGEEDERKMCASPLPRSPDGPAVTSVAGQTSPGAKTCPVLVGWSEAEDDCSADQHHCDDFLHNVPPSLCAPPMSLAPAHNGTPHGVLSPPHRRGASPHPVFVVPSRSSSVESRRSSSVQESSAVPAAVSGKRWEEVRVPSGRRFRSPTPSIPQPVNPYDDDFMHANNNYANEDFGCSRHLNEVPSMRPSPSSMNGDAVRHREGYQDTVVDALAVAGYQHTLTSMHHGGKDVPALASFSTSAAHPPGSFPLHRDPSRSSSAAYSDGAASYYTTENLFPTRIRASLARSQSPPSVGAMLPPRPAPLPNKYSRHDPVIESGNVWGDVGSTTAAASTPRDSLNSSSVGYYAGTGCVDHHRRREDDSVRSRIVKAVSTSLTTSTCGTTSGHVSISESQQQCPPDQSGHAHSEAPKHAHGSLPPMVPSRALPDNSPQSPQLPDSSQRDTSVASAGCLVEVEEENLPAQREEGPTPTPPVNAQAGRQPTEGGKEDDDVFMDVRCEEGPHKGGPPSTPTYQELLTAATRGSSLPRESSPAYSTQSFLTVLSGRAASARGLSTDMLDRAGSVGGDKRREGKPNSAAQWLGSAMEQVVPADPSMGKAVPPSAKNASRVESPPFHDFISTFGRDSEEREMLLLEVQRQRIAAEAAVIELQLKSAERQRAGDGTRSPASTGQRMQSISPEPLPHRQVEPRATMSDLNVNYESVQPKSEWGTVRKKDPSLGRSQSRASTLQDLFAMAASGVVGSTKHSSSASNLQQQRASSEEMRKNLTRLEQLAASDSPAFAAPQPPPYHHDTVSPPPEKSQALVAPLASASSSSSGGNTRSASSLRNWSVSSPSAVATPTEHHRGSSGGASTPLFSPMVYRNCSALRPLTRSLLSSLIRLDGNSNGSVTMHDCVQVLHSVLGKANTGAVDAAHAKHFLSEIMSRVQHANGGGVAQRFVDDVDMKGTMVPYAALVSTIVEIASEAEGGRLVSPGGARATGSFQNFNFGSPTFPQFA